MYVYRPGAKLFYQATGAGEPDVVLCPPSQPAMYSRMWKYQVPYLSRYFRVVTLDPRGNGRTSGPSAYDDDVVRCHGMICLDAAVVGETAQDT